MKLKLIPNTFMKLKMTSSTIAVLILTLTIKGVLDLTRKKKLNPLVTHHLNTTTNLKNQKKLVIAVSCSAVLWNPSKNVIAWREDAPQLLSIWKSAGMLILILFLDIGLYNMIINYNDYNDYLITITTI